MTIHLELIAPQQVAEKLSVPATGGVWIVISMIIGNLDHFHYSTRSSSATRP
jgi:hypothetical protein